MTESALWWASIAIGVAMAAGIFIALATNIWHRYAQWDLKRKASRCQDIIATVMRSNPENLLPVIIELKKSFADEMIEPIIEEHLLNSTGDTKRTLSRLYEQLGFLQKLIADLAESKSWVKRAEAAEKLGVLGHPNAVMGLIASIRHPTEEQDVKNVAIRALGRIKDPRAIAFLLEGLGLAEEGTGQPLADALLQFGEIAIDPLCETLVQSDNENRRYWSARILGSLNSRQSAQTLIRALKDHSDKVREAAIKALGGLNEKQAALELREIMLHDPVPGVRLQAAQALGQIADDASLQALGQALLEADEDTRHRSMEALSGMGGRAVPIFLDILARAQSSGARAAAASGLERVGFVDTLIERLISPDLEELSFNALVHMAQAGAIDTMARSLRHPKIIVRQKLCQIFNHIKNPRVFESLMDLAVTETDPDVRYLAIKALVKMGEEKALPIILKALKEGSRHRITILEALIPFSTDSLKSIGADIAPLAQNPDVGIRQAAVKLLGFIPTDMALTALLESLKDSASMVREQAAIALGRRASSEKTPSSNQSLKALVEALGDPDSKIRVAAVRSLGSFGRAEALEPLLRAFNRADESYRDDIADAISKIPSDEIFSILDKIQLTEPKTKAGIAWTLGLIADKRGYSYLRRLLHDQEPIVRAAAAGGLGQFGDAQTALILEEFLADPNERVRAAAINALARGGNVSGINKIYPSLNDPDSFVQQRAAVAIGIIGSKLSADSRGESKKYLKKWREINEGDEKKSMAGLIGLTYLEERSIFAECLKALHDPSKSAIIRGMIKSLPYELGREFFKALSLDIEVYLAAQGKIAETVAHYIKLLKSSRNATDRVRAIESLTLLRPSESLPSIEDALTSDPVAEVRAQALVTISKMTPTSQLIEKLARAARDPSELVRSQAVPLFKQLSPKELEQSRQILIPLFDCSDQTVHETVCELAARAYHHDWQELKSLVGRENSKNMTLGIIETLGRIGNPKSADVFLKFMNSTQADIRSCAAGWSAQMGLLSKADLMPFLGDPQESVRLAVVKGLGLQLDAETIEHLAARIEDPSPKVRRTIALVLGKARTSGDDRPILILEKLLQDERVEVKTQSLISLFRLGYEGVITRACAILKEIPESEKPTLINQLEREGVLLEMTGIINNDRNPQKRKEALMFLASLDSQKYQSQLLAALNDPSSDVRAEAIHHLKSIQNSDIEGAVLRLASDPSETVRMAVEWFKLKI